MTERLAETGRRIESVDQLGTVVTVMRGISASRVQQAHGLLAGVRAYASVIAGAIGQALAMVPATPGRGHGRAASIVFCAEQGFAGAFSDRVLEAADGPNDIFLIGTRGASLARERGIVPVWQTAMVPQANLMPNLAGRIADALYDWVTEKGGHRVETIVPVWSPGKGVVVERRSLLPFDFQRFPVARGPGPLTTLPPTDLLGRLAEEYVFAELCEAALTAFAAENEARVATMLSAKTNLEDMLTELLALQRQIRQEEITAEVIELAASADAVT